MLSEFQAGDVEGQVYRGETPFFFKKGENPDNIKLNLIIKGKGTVWIDDIRLLKGPFG